MKIYAFTGEELVSEVPYEIEDRSRSCSATLTRFENPVGMLEFITRCSGSKNAWEQKVQIQDWDLLDEETQKITNWDILTNDAPDVFLNDVKVKCNCPAFKYWGSNYILDQLDSSITPENRAPSIRDPSEENILCKHLTAVLNKFFT